MKARLFFQLAPLVFLLNADAGDGPAALVNSLTSKDSGYEVTQRGQDFAVLQQTTASTDAAGNTRLATNQITLLENCLQYLEDGEWKYSEDVVEASENGAMAQRGPNKTLVSSDLNAQAVFDIQ